MAVEGRTNIAGSKSKFGLHIIQLVSRAGDDAIIRHILIIPPVTETEVNIAKARLDSIRTDIVNNKIAFAQAVNKYSDDDNGKFTGGHITNPQDGSILVTIDQLDKDLVMALKNMNPGDISKPIAYTDERGMQHVRIINFQTRTEPHVENLKDDYSVISNKALEERKCRCWKNGLKAIFPLTIFILIMTMPAATVSKTGGTQRIWRITSSEMIVDG
jgi:peptidyl-prolyl cis-trans isomerase SurA